MCSVFTVSLGQVKLLTWFAPIKLPEMVKEVKKTGCRNTSGFFFSDCRNLQFLARNVISKVNEVTEKKIPGNPHEI